MGCIASKEANAQNNGGGTGNNNNNNSNNNNGNNNNNNGNDSGGVNPSNSNNSGGSGNDGDESKLITINPTNGKKVVKVLLLGSGDTGKRYVSCVVALRSAPHQIHSLIFFVVVVVLRIQHF